LLKKFPFGTNGKKLIINVFEIIRKQFFSFIGVFLKLSLLAIVSNFRYIDKLNNNIVNIKIRIEFIFNYFLTINLNQ